MTAAENRAEWVRRLRSGEYQQRSGRLAHKDGSFCVMGVGALAAADAGVVGFNSDSGVFSTGSTPFEGWIATVPSIVIQWLGVSTDTVGSLMRMNDSGKYTFEQMADFIESEEG